jgi:glycosyltransferase involved in cell wall biosynthesis
LKNDTVNIVYLINGLSSGGAETMLYRLLCGLDKSRFIPTVITLQSFPGPLQEKIEALNIDVYEVKVKSKFDLTAVLRVYNLIRRLKPKILHTQLFASDMLGRTIGRILKVPVIITAIRNIYYGSFSRYLLYKITERFSDKTVFVSNAAAKRFVELNIVSKEKVKVIHNGLDLKDFYAALSKEEKRAIRTDLSLPEVGFLMLAVGRLSRQKGYSELFKALIVPEKMKRLDYTLIIAGTGSLQQELEKEVRDLGLHHRVSFIGRCDDIPALMAASDALILNSLWEGLPGVVMEAMASELPVVATNVGGTSELVDDGKTGYLVQPAEPGEIKDALANLMGLSEEERRIMGKAGREKVKKQFYVEKMVSEYEQLYYEALNDKVNQI